MKTMATFQQPIQIQFILINFVNIFATISHSIKQTSALVLETQKKNTYSNNTKYTTNCIICIRKIYFLLLVENARESTNKMYVGL